MVVFFPLITIALLIAASVQFVYKVPAFLQLSALADSAEP